MQVMPGAIMRSSAMRHCEWQCVRCWRARHVNARMNSGLTSSFSTSCGTVNDLLVYSAARV